MYLQLKLKCFFFLDWIRYNVPCILPILRELVNSNYKLQMTGTCINNKLNTVVSITKSGKTCKL